MSIPFILTDNSLTVMSHDPNVDDFTMHREHVQWDAAMEALNADDYDGLMLLMRPKTALDHMNRLEEGAFIVEGNDIFFNGEKLPADYTVTKIISFIKQGLPHRPLFAFFGKLIGNPSYRVRRTLMQFVDQHKLPITSDGDILTYKYTRPDGFDRHSGTVLYTNRTWVEMPRNEVNDDPDQTCSAGLHVASRSYFGSGGSGDRFIVCRVHPGDVVSLPRDGAEGKLRVCRLFVEAVLAGPPVEDNIYGEEVVDDPSTADTEAQSGT